MHNPLTDSANAPDGADHGNHRSTNLTDRSPSVNRYSDDLELALRDSYAAMLRHAQRTVEAAWRCGHLLNEARLTADRREGGFRGVLARAGIPKTTAYRLVDLFQRYPEVSQMGHFPSVDAALRALPAPATAPTGTEEQLQAEIERLQDGQRAMEEQSTELDAKRARLERRNAELLVAASGNPKIMACYAEAQLTRLQIADSKRILAEHQTKYEAERRRAAHYKRIAKRHGIDVRDPDLWRRQ